MNPNNQPQPKPALSRTQKIEQFLLDPQKVVFESLQEFETALQELLDILSAVDIDKLETLQGEDGKTPVRGVDYFTEEDLQNIEAFIISKIPKVGVELPSRIQVESFISAEIAKIPRIKGDKGDAGKPGKDGNDGSPDTGADIIAKLRALPKNQKLKIADIRGLENVLKPLVDVVDEVAALKEDFANQKFVIPAQATGEGGEGGATSFTDLDDVPSAYTGLGGQFVKVKADETGLETGTPAGAGDMEAATYDPQNIAGDAFDTDNHTDGTTNKVFTATEKTKLAGIETAADVTDATNVAAAGAFMKSVDDTDDITEGSTKKFATAAEKTKLGHISVTQAVDLDAIETRVNALDAAVVLKGVWDASAGTFPGSGSAQAGESYIVSVGGTVDGQVFVANDRILAIVDNASTGTYAANWHKLDYTDQVLSVASKTGAVTLDANDVAEVVNKRYMTDAQETKLDSVESSADVTDAGNVGSVNAAATSKGTPVDADSFPIVDSEASNVIKRVTFTNLKAFLKTYIDSMTSTFTNKRITKRVGSTTSSATPTINTDNVDIYKLTAQTVDITSFTTNLSGTPTDGQTLIIQITGTAARAITWGSSFEASTVALPTTTVTTAMLTVGFIYNAVTSKWRCVASA